MGLAYESGPMRRCVGSASRCSSGTAIFPVGCARSWARPDARGSRPGRGARTAIGPVSGGWIEFMPVDGTVGNLRSARLGPTARSMPTACAVGRERDPPGQRPDRSGRAYLRLFGRFTSPIRRMIPAGPSGPLEDRPRRGNDPSPAGPVRRCRPRPPAPRRKSHEFAHRAIAATPPQTATPAEAPSSASSIATARATCTSTGPRSGSPRPSRHRRDSSGSTSRPRMRPGRGRSKRGSRGVPVPPPGGRGRTPGDARPQGGRLGLVPLHRLPRPADRRRHRYPRAPGTGLRSSARTTSSLSTSHPWRSSRPSAPASPATPRPAPPGPGSPPVPPARAGRRPIAGGHRGARRAGQRDPEPGHRAPSPKVVRTIFRIKRSAIQLHKTLAPQREVLNRLARDPYSPIRAEHRVYFRDLYDHVVRIHDISESLRDLIAGTLETYLSVDLEPDQRDHEDLDDGLGDVPADVFPGGLLRHEFLRRAAGAARSAMPRGLLFVATCAMMAISPCFMWIYAKRKKWF